MVGTRVRLREGAACHTRTPCGLSAFAAASTASRSRRCTASISRSHALAAGSGPNLRTSPVILDAAAFRSVVKEGALVPAGMPAFETIDDPTLEAIRHYLRIRAQQFAAEKRAPPVR